LSKENLEPRKIGNIDLEFEIAAERESARRVIHGQEFDEVFHELGARLQTLEKGYMELQNLIEQYAKDRVRIIAWMKEAARHI